MTIDKVLDVVTMYETSLRKLSPYVTPRRCDFTLTGGQVVEHFNCVAGNWCLERHLLYMFGEMRKFAAEGRVEKLMRWLGFAQGVLWMMDNYTLDELKSHNMPIEGGR